MEIPGFYFQKGLQMGQKSQKSFRELTGGSLLFNGMLPYTRFGTGRRPVSSPVTRSSLVTGGALEVDSLDFDLVDFFRAFHIFHL